MTFRLLFFLPRKALRWVYDQAHAEHLMDTPVALLFISIDSLGIWFPYKGDEVVWTWPWRRKGLAPLISLTMSGTGEWGDARYWTLKELDNVWEMFYKACDEAPEMEEAFESLATALAASSEAALQAAKAVEELTIAVELFDKQGPDGAIGRVV